jgi:hypothetical protein
MNISKPELSEDESERAIELLTQLEVEDGEELLRIAPLVTPSQVLLAQAGKPPSSEASAIASALAKVVEAQEEGVIAEENFLLLLKALRQ